MHLRIFVKTAIMVCIFHFYVVYADVPAASLPVFPGAEGFGTATVAGRGGTIIRVTNINCSGAGSLKDAIVAQGPRTIIFDIAGTIELKANLVIENPYVTIAGQTAPPPGITIKGAGLAIRTHDVLVQHIRIRVGDNDLGPGFDNRDALYIEDAPKQNDVFNVVIDHCSFSWAVDENVSLWYAGVHDVTIRNCIVSEGLNSPKHPKGPHSKGLIVGPGIQNVSVIGNVFAHNQQRNPYLRESATVLVANNVVYNYGDVCASFGGSLDTPPMAVSIIGNVFIPGPNSTTVKPIFANNLISNGSKFYISDNEAPTATEDPWSVADIRSGFDLKVYSPPIMTNPLSVWARSDALNNALSGAGARPADRDAVDNRIIAEVRNKGGHLISSQNDVGGWPTLTPTTRVLALPANLSGDDDQDGYTNLEELLFSMANDVEGLNSSIKPPTNLRLERLKQLMAR